MTYRLGRVGQVDNLRADCQSVQTCAVNTRAQDTILPHVMFVYTSTHDETAPAVYEATSPRNVSALRNACLGG
jgi:hypothetical protein